MWRLNIYQLVMMHMPWTYHFLPIDLNVNKVRLKYEEVTTVSDMSHRNEERVVFKASFLKLHHLHLPPYAAMLLLLCVH